MSIPDSGRDRVMTGRRGGRNRRADRTFALTAPESGHDY